MTTQHNESNPYAPPAAAPRGTTAPVTLTYYATRKRRRWQFSLGLLMAVVTGICLALGTLAYSVPALLAMPFVHVLTVVFGSLVAILLGAAVLLVIRFRRNHVRPS